MARTATLPKDLLSNYDVMYMFDVRVQRIYHHRRRRGMPHHNIPGTSKSPAVRYSLKEIVAWAKKNKIKIKRMPTIGKNGKIKWNPRDQKGFKAFQQSISL